MTSNTSAERVSFGPVASENYERQMGRWSRKLSPLFLDFVALESSSKRTLDAGCGTGSLTFALAEQYAQAEIRGCDIAHELLSHASSANHDPRRVTFESGDICNLQYGDGQFDAALSSLVL